MKDTKVRRRLSPWASIGSLWTILTVAGIISLSACSNKSVPMANNNAMPAASMSGGDMTSMSAPSPDPRVGLGAGLFDAKEAAWNVKLISSTKPTKDFIGVTNSDLAFTGHYAIQGNYNGIQVWDISNPVKPTLVTGYVCPASQSDVSVYKNLLFVSGEGLGGRLDCGAEGVDEAVSMDRLRGIRIFDITDIRNPKYISNVQTCRGSHTHSLLKDPDDDDNVYIYVSGSAPVRPAEEVDGCTSGSEKDDPNTALFRIEVIKVPLANPAAAKIVSSPRIFEDLVAPPVHGQAPADITALAEARARGEFIADVRGQSFILPPRMVKPMLDGMVKKRGGEVATAADSTALREALPALIAERFGIKDEKDDGPKPGPTQCHDITLYPGIGMAGGACGGYGLLLDIRDPANPKRMDAVADSNFSYWHSATFNNDGTKVLFSDEWGGGGQPKCRATDPKEWGADAIFTLDHNKMEFKSYYKMAAPQTSEENCVAHNGSLIPIPGRDVMVQSWYQGGISVFDWTDASHPKEIAYHDRGPVAADHMANGGTWSVYWYNGVMVSSEIARGLDIFELEPSALLSANEIAAAKTVHLDHLNTQGQPKFVWPATYALAQAYVDQLERSKGLSRAEIASARQSLNSAEKGSGSTRKNALAKLSKELSKAVSGSNDSSKVQKLVSTVRNLGM